MSKKNDKIKSDIDKMIKSGMKKTNAIKEYATFNIFGIGERQIWNIMKGDNALSNTQLK